MEAEFQLVNAPVITPVFQDVDAPDIALIKRLPPSLKRPTMTYVQPATATRGNKDSGFFPSEYPLLDIGAAEDTDSYVYQAVFKKLALAMKEGWSLVGKNQDTIDYVRERFNQLEIAQGQTIRSMLIELMGALLRYHSVFILKARNAAASGGKVRRIGNKKLKPVAGYFVASPDTMEIKPGKDYRPKAYKHVMPDGRKRFFKPEDVIHVHVNKKPHFLTPTPPWHPVIEDVTALRRIEEHIENLVYQHIYPLFQYKVGTENHPMQRYEDGSTEADVVRAKIRDMPSDGMIVTPERHEISGLGSESRALRAEPYVEHFKKRVIAGTGMSQLDFGDGNTANRSTADSMSKLATSNVKFYQQCLADYLNFHLIRELLQESMFGFDVLKEENKVEIQFAEIDHEASIARENHEMLRFTNNLTTRTEARLRSGMEPMALEQEEDCYSCKVTMKEIEAKGDIEPEKAKQAASQRAAQNKSTPSNQHGTKTGPAKRKSSRDMVAADLFHQLVQDLRRVNPRAVNLGFIEQVFFITRDQMKRSFAPHIRGAVFSGTQGLPINQGLAIRLSAAISRVQRDFESDVDRLFRASMSRTVAELARGIRDRLTIDRLEYRIRFIERSILKKAETLGAVAAMQANGIEKAVVRSVVGGEDYPIWNGVVIELKGVSDDQLPPYHPNCKCTLEPVGAPNGG